MTNYSMTDVNILTNLIYTFRRQRLEIELSYYYNMVLQNAPRNINYNDSFFEKLKKNSLNWLNNSTYENYKKKSLYLENYILEFEKRNYNSCYYTDEEITRNVRDVFENDTFGLAKLELVMNIVLDDFYEFETDDISFSRISILLDLESDFLMMTFKSMQSIYSKISINKRSINTKALTIASLISIPLIIGGVGALIGGYGASASITTAALAKAGFELGMAEGVAVLCLSSAVATGVTYGVTYMCLDATQKHKLKSEFASLSVDQMTISLVKTIVFLMQLACFDCYNAKQLYNSYMQEYLDLKSDCDYRLFIKEEKTEENKEKNSIFANADNFIKKNLIDDN